MQTGKNTSKISSKGRYMDIIRPAQKKPKTVKRPAVIEATRVTAEVYDPEIDDVETIDELEYSIASVPRPTPKPTPKPRPTIASAPRPRPVKKSYPFITSVNVDKRPLSPYVPANNAAASRPAKNVYSAPAKPLKKVKKTTDSKEKSTKIVESPKQSGLSLVIIIIITVILGAAAGVGAYLLLPH